MCTYEYSIDWRARVLNISIGKGRNSYVYRTLRVPCAETDSCVVTRADRRLTARTAFVGTNSRHVWSSEPLPIYVRLDGKRRNAFRVIEYFARVRHHSKFRSAELKMDSADLPWKTTSGGKQKIWKCISCNDVLTLRVFPYRLCSPVPKFTYSPFRSTHTIYGVSTGNLYCWVARWSGPLWFSNRILNHIPKYIRRGFAHFSNTDSKLSQD